MKQSLLLLVFIVVICCVIYPVSLWVAGQLLFPFQANGSLLVNDEGVVVGSRLIAQSFTQDRYFHPRPSAVAYNAAASASSALAPSNPKLRERVEEALKKVGKEGVPADMVTTSASGLDPHITLANAAFQLDRVVAAWATHLKRDPASLKVEIGQIVEKSAFAPLGGLVGEKMINVLEVNLELYRFYHKNL